MINHANISKIFQIYNYCHLREIELNTHTECIMAKITPQKLGEMFAAGPNLNKSPYITITTIKICWTNSI